MKKIVRNAVPQFDATSEVIGLVTETGYEHMPKTGMKTERAPRLFVKNGGSPRCARRASIDHQLDGVDVGGVI